MNLNDTKQHDETMGVAGPRRARSRVWRAGLTVAALVGAGVLAAACVGASSSTAHSGAPGPSTVSLDNRALAYVNCMRTHGEPDMPDPTSQGGRHISINITANSGVDPTSPRFTAANNACRRLLPHGGARSAGRTITPTQQADYLKGVACMRTHGFPGFPDPVFQGNRVTFTAAGSPINTKSPQFKSALTTCQTLIPQGLPDSSPSGS